MRQNKKNQKENTERELRALASSANELYLAVFAATLFSKDTPEMRRIKMIADNLRVAIVSAHNQLRAAGVNLP